MTLDEQGRSQFNELLFRRGEPRFFAFYMILCEEKDLRYEGLHERKRQLKALMGTERSHLLYCDLYLHRQEDRHGAVS